MGVRIAAAAVIAICTAQAAGAGGIEITPTFYDWTGVYVGAHVGYGSGNIKDTVSGATTSTSQDFSGVIAGGQAGANFQYRSVVFGVEADGDWSGQQGSGTVFTASVPWLATARMRIGFAHDRLLYYATGGAAYVQFKSTDLNGIESTSTRTAWVAGVGQESVITRNLILRFEALYLQLLGNGDTVTGVTPVTPVTSTRTVYDIVGRVGLSYKFDWSGN
jgi:outer membrane immunogenic protein